MICWQVYASNLQHLTKWKGGGYGMYTDSHPEHRSIAIRENDAITIIYPIGLEEFKKLSPTAQSQYTASKKILKLAAFYPEYYRDELLKCKWFQSFDKKNAIIEFYESYLDIDQRKIYPNKIYSYE